MREEYKEKQAFIKALETAIKTGAIKKQTIGNAMHP